MPGAQTPRTGSYQNLSGKGEMSSSSDEENSMDLQQCQGNSSEEVTRTQEIKTVPRPISPASIEVTDEFIAEHSLEITQAISLKENLGNWAQALAAAKDERTAPSSQEGDSAAAPRRKIDLSGNKNKSVSSPKGSPVKESKKRVADEDGFIAPAAHLVRKIKNLKPNSVKNKEIEIKKVPEGIEEVALDNEVDADPSPAQPKQKRVPPFFVTPRADFRTMLNILKLEAPSLRSVMSNKFLKLTVETEEEHRSLSHLLESQGAEFKTFMLKQDRPIKVVIRGLQSCTPIEDINRNSEGTPRLPSRSVLA
ncbi:hypothetical protein HNY73_007817 [Argiope bruennichi]|uniref:Uncharacterized protein n=1 Tax=Argiope bruennichi TaxID=94029 RepID=A0A8T0FHQ9_ARGBR|nr:hypothetical protein HNY73_007817 [Argiope bruennichi]